MSKIRRLEYDINKKSKFLNYNKLFLNYNPNKNRFEVLLSTAIPRLTHILQKVKKIGNKRMDETQNKRLFNAFSRQFKTIYSPNFSANNNDHCQLAPHSPSPIIKS